MDGLVSNGVNVEGRIKVSDRAHLLFDLHQTVDGLREAELAKSKIGTTRRGIGPCYANKVLFLFPNFCWFSISGVSAELEPFLTESGKYAFLVLAFRSQEMAYELEICVIWIHLGIN